MPVTRQLESNPRPLAGVEESADALGRQRGKGRVGGFELRGGNFARPSSGRKAMDDDTPLPVS